MSEGIKLDAIITVAVRPDTDLTVSYGTSFPGNNAPIAYEENTTIYVADSQEEVTYTLYQGETPSSGIYITEEVGTGAEISLPVDDDLTENTTFCVLADKGNGVTAQLKDPITVVVKPDPDREIVANPDIVNHGQSSDIQVLLSQSSAKYYIQGLDYGPDTSVTGNGRTITLPTADLEDDTTFMVKAINLDEDPDTVVEINNGNPVQVQVRPDPDVEITIPDLNEQKPAGDNGTVHVARVVRNRELTVEIDDPQNDVNYQLWKEGDDSPVYDGSNLALTGETYTMQSGPLGNAASFRILALKSGSNNVVLTNTVQVELAEQVNLVSDLVHYGGSAAVEIMASEEDKIYILYTGIPEEGTEEQRSNGDESGGGIITLETRPLENDTGIYITQQPKSGGDELTIATFHVNLTERIVAEPSLIPYNGIAKIIVGKPVPDAIYQLRENILNNSVSAEVTGVDENTAVELTTIDSMKDSMLFNVLETLPNGTETELRPVVAVSVMPEIALEQDAIPYNTSAVINICDTVDERTYTLTSDISGGDVTGEEVYDTETKITTLTSSKLTETAMHTITISDNNGKTDTVEVMVGNRVTAVSPVGYGSWVVVEVADTLEGEKDTYELHDEDGSVDTENTYIGGEAGITILTTVEGIKTEQTYQVKKTGTGAGTIGTDFIITVNPQVSALSPISYNTQAAIRIAATENGKQYGLYVDDVLLEGSGQDGNSGTLELTSPDPLREVTTFQVKDGNENLVGNEVTVTLNPQAYAETGEVLYNTETVNIIVTAAIEDGVEYEAKYGLDTYPQDGISVEGEDVIIPVNRPFTESMDFEVYQVANPSNIPINDVRIRVTHQVVESEIHIDYDGPAFIRLASSIHPDDNDNMDVTYKLRLDANNDDIVGSEQTGNGGELIFTTPDNTEDTWYNILAVIDEANNEYEEFRVQVIRETSLPAEVDISTDGPAMVTYEDTAVVALQTEDDNTKTYEILDGTGTTLTGSGVPVAGDGSTLSYTTNAITQDKNFFARVSETAPEPDDDNRVKVYMSRKTVMAGLLHFARDNSPSDSVVLPDADILEFAPGQSFSIETWVNIEDPLTDVNPNHYRCIVTNKSFATWNRPGFGVSFSYEDPDSAFIDAVIQDVNGGDFDTLKRITDGSVAYGVWQHIAVVFNRSNNQTVITMYHNGDAISAYTYPDSYDSDLNLTNAIHFMSDVNKTYGNTGILSDVRIWNKALTQPEIETTMNTRLNGDEPNLIGYWKLDAPGTMAEDATTNGNDGTVEGATWLRHYVVEKTITIDQNMPVAVSVGSSRSDTEYKLLFADNDNDASAELSGTGDDSILTLVTTNLLTEDTQLKVITTDGEEVGAVEVTITDPGTAVATEIAGGKAMVTYGDNNASITFTGVTAGTVCELLDETYTIIIDGEAAGTSITLTTSIEGDTQFTVRTKENNGQTVCISKAPLIMVGLLQFDHTAETKNYVKITDNEIFHFTADQDFSVETWIKPGTLPGGNRCIVSNRDFDASSNVGFGVFFNDSEIHAYVKESDTIHKDTLGFEIGDQSDAWNHFAVVFNRENDKTIIQIYHNGIMVTNQEFMEKASFDFSNPVYFMSDTDESDKTYSCPGILSDVRIWNKALIQSEIETNMNTRLAGTEANLIGYWKLDEGADTTAGNSAEITEDADGTIEGAVWLNEEE